MKTRLRMLLAVVSGILTVFLLVVSVWSYFSGIGIIGLNSNTSFSIHKGVLNLRYIYQYEPSVAADQWPGDPIPQKRINPPPPAFPWVGYSAGYQLGIMQLPGRITPANYSRFYFPVWVPAIVLAVWSIRCYIIYLRYRRPPGYCSACGYDLRGSSGSEACPECGEEIPKRQSNLVQIVVGVGESLSRKRLGARPIIVDLQIEHEDTRPFVALRTGVGLHETGVRLVADKGVKPQAAFKDVYSC